MTFRLGLQIPNFSYDTGVGELFPTVVRQAKEAESAGFDALLLMDHLYQLPQLGAPEEPMLECYTALSALAAVTDRLQLGALVTGNTYRNPAFLAKVVSTLDVVSAGRAILGIGAGWYELEHVQLGYEFGNFADRFERLSEALSIIVPMLQGERPTVNGKWYRAERALAAPLFRDDLPIMLGGGGEGRFGWRLGTPTI
jgi:alkanesulfonate monooxygenase SsuD/methylene tetrahydromethanopterin reductase-like flavin-dependent oxidoreductase (luciferase family)